ncbi:MAG: hypothetical protein Q7S27_03660 [Nanoarchaeota archaeon]|nr:hypothetical protein [Nanoarchaeota archaeon]
MEKKIGVIFIVVFIVFGLWVVILLSQMMNISIFGENNNLGETGRVIDDSFNDKNDGDLINNGNILNEGGREGFDGKESTSNDKNFEFEEGNEIANGDKQLCLVVRPGNLPNIECKVNYIHEGEISLKIANSMGENLFVSIFLSGCASIVNGEVLNNGNLDFIFFCETDEYIEKEMIMTYNIGSSSIELNGIVIGPVKN